LKLENLLLVAMGPLLEQRAHRVLGHVGPADEPLVIGLDREHRDEPDQRRVVGEDADDVGAPADLAVEALERIGASSAQGRPARSALLVRLKAQLHRARAVS